MANEFSPNQSNNTETLVAVFDNYSDAQSAVNALAKAGYGTERIRVTPELEASDIATDANNPSDSRAIEDNDTNETGHSGGIIGFFRSLFGGEEHHDYHDSYSESVRRGHYVLTLDAQNDEELNRASDIINQFNPVDIDERASSWKQQGWKGYDASAPRLTSDEIARDRASYEALRPSNAATNTADTAIRTSSRQDEARIPVVEEELKVGKREVQRGGVRVFQRVIETPVNESVQLRDEHVKVERHPVEQGAIPTDSNAFNEQSFELREFAEEPVVSKTARVVEEVTVGKEVTQRTENIDDTVRRTDVEVEQLGSTSNQSAARFDSSNDNDFRGHWQTNFGSTGGRYEDYAPAYSYGSTLASRDEYRDKKWDELEPQVRDDWESNHPGSAWEKVKDAVRYGVERVTGNHRQ